MTRAIISVVNGNFKDAIEYNWRVLIVFPLLLYIYFLNIYKVYKKIKKLNQASWDYIDIEKMPLTSHSPLAFVSKICGKSKLRFSVKVLKVISGSGAVTNH